MGDLSVCSELKYVILIIYKLILLKRILFLKISLPFDVTIEANIKFDACLAHYNNKTTFMAPNFFIYALGMITQELKVKSSDNGASTHGVRSEGEKNPKSF